MEQCYFDFNATTPLTHEYLQGFTRWIGSFETLGNPSSQHAFGRNASVALETLKKKVGNLFDLEANQVILTSGATESNQLGVAGVLLSQATGTNISRHAITSAAEHPSVLRQFQIWENSSPHHIVTYLKPNPKTGVIYAQDIIDALKSTTCFVSVMAANNETGHIYEVKKFAQWLHKARWESSPKKTSKGPAANSDHAQHPDPNISAEQLQKLHFHCDAVQAFGKIPISEWWDLGIDSISISGHKLGGVAGVGFLILRKGRRYSPLFVGGSQERNRRAGTENLIGALSFHYTLESYFENETAFLADWETQRSLLIKTEELLLKWPCVKLVSQLSSGLPNTIHFVLDKDFADSQDFLMQMDMAGCYLSSGSACSSGAQLPSHVLTSLGFDDLDAKQGIRISSGLKTTKDDFEHLKKTLLKILPKLA